MAQSLTAQYATVSDVADELGQEIAADSAQYRQIQRWLDRVERQIRARVQSLDDWASGDESYRATVNDVEVAAVERKARNPDGTRSVMTQVDDGNFQTTIDPSRSTGEIVILDSEWAALLRTADTRAFSITMRALPDAFPLPSYPFGC